ncbi:cupin [Agrococcus casei]|uniref:cupin n=1 Tax=Agrococcus casei TaxID=343512 RepID=UPI003F8EB0CD
MATSRVFLDDDRFRITEWTIEPGDAIEMHEHEYDYAVVGVERSVMWAVLPDGSELEVQVEPGVAYTRQAGAAHQMENRGDVRVVFTEVEAKAYGKGS